MDGELPVWDPEAGRLSFERWQHRAAAHAHGVPTLAARTPCFMAFDVLRLDGAE
ncbi:hypothetical protein [Streptomyces virginiae]